MNKRVGIWKLWFLGGLNSLAIAALFYGIVWRLGGDGDRLAPLLVYISLCLYLVLCCVSLFMFAFFIYGDGKRYASLRHKDSADRILDVLIFYLQMQVRMIVGVPCILLGGYAGVIAFCFFVLFVSYCCHKILVHFILATNFEEMN